MSRAWAISSEDYACIIRVQLQSGAYGRFQLALWVRWSPDAALRVNLGFFLWASP